MVIVDYQSFLLKHSFCNISLALLSLRNLLFVSQTKQTTCYSVGERSVGDAHGVENVIAIYEEDVDCYLNVKNTAQAEDTERVRIR